MSNLKHGRIIVGRPILYLVIGIAIHAARGQESAGQVVPQAAQQLLVLANEARAQAGVGALKWDEALASAARDHTLRMAAEGPIAHRYGGEDDLSTRAGKAGAHFDLIEENVAVGPNPAQIQDEWMHSPGHRENLLNKDVNRIGIAVVSVRGVLYATADFARGVQAFNREQIEARVAGLVQVSGVTILSNHALARAACSGDGPLPLEPGQAPPGFMMKWQDSDLKELPKQLTEKLASGQYHRAAIGSCTPQDVEGDFTAYRVAVLLY
jgi:Cysteine-rich secretory protein family